MHQLYQLLKQRFGQGVPDEIGDDQIEKLPEQWVQMAGRGSCRNFTGEPVPPQIIETLCALSLCAPTKSDLQQRDIVVVDGETPRKKLHQMLTSGPLGQSWISGSPNLLVFCGNNRRQRLIHEWRQKPFVNDHLDAFFNATVDAAIAMANFVVAAEAAGLGCCPISAIRNKADEVSKVLLLPDYVFPVVALAIGWPKNKPKISLRQPLSVSLHKDIYREENLQNTIAAYDKRRAGVQPYAKQRYVQDFGQASTYGWSEDKARQYAKPERENFGEFVRSKKFKLT